MSRSHKVVGITDESASTLKVQTRDGQEMSMRIYFQKHYQTQIKYLELPCLILSSQSKNYMPMELCSIVENQVVNDEKTYEYYGKFKKIMFPSTRIQKISNFMKEILSKRYLK